MTELALSTNLILFLGENLIGATGIKFLVKSDMFRLEYILLSKCELGDEGAKHLAKADWPFIKSIDLCILLINKAFNHIGLSGCASLSQSKWKKLSTLTLI